MAMQYASLPPAADRRPSPAAASPLSAGNGGVGLGEEAQMNGRWAATLATFTASQYEELEQQALIYKYLVAGVPVPSSLQATIRRGLDFIAGGFYTGHPALGYGAYFGKKMDQEPGRCRRTDGKKWRCSKEAALDSKYCERHMHRGRSRSRKPVETQLAPNSQPPPATAPAPLSAVAPLAAANIASNFHNHSLYPAIAGSNAGIGGGGHMSSPYASPLGSSSQLHMDNAASYATVGGGTGKDLRYTTYRTRSLADEHSQLITEAINTSIENPWRLLPSQNCAFPLASYPQLGALSGLSQNTVNSLPKVERQPLAFFGNDYGSLTSVKQENQTLRPFFDEWPKARDSWSDLADENANLSSFSATQLSISIPMASSDFSVASSQSGD